jgi:hypothetical protein
VWCANTAAERRDAIKAWKRSFSFDDRQCAEFAEDTANLILEWSGCVFVGRVAVTVPPRGASLFGDSAGWPYAAELLARAVADRLGFPFVPGPLRTDTKRHHGPWWSLKQAPYVFDVPDQKPCMILVVDDLITSGTTMKLALRAIRGAGVPAFGFAYNGHGEGGG